MVRIIKCVYLFLKGTLLASERREVRYSIGPFDFLEGDLLTILSSTPSLSPTLASSAMFTYTNKFSADLFVELIPLPTWASSAMSDSKFLVDWVGCSKHRNEWFG